MNLWPFSFDDSVWQLRLSAQPWGRRETKNHLNRSKSTQKPYQNQINIRMKQGNMFFYFKSSIVFRTLWKTVLSIQILIFLLSQYNIALYRYSYIELGLPIETHEMIRELQCIKSDSCVHNIIFRDGFKESRSHHDQLMIPLMYNNAAVKKLFG